MKIALLGYSGSGKSTLAKYLSEQYGLPLLYLDTVQFEPGWKIRDRQEARAMVAEFLKNEQWVIDGNYGAFLQEERLEQADQIIFLLFSRWNCLRRAIKRYHTYRHCSRESITAGCPEKIDAAFVWWILHEGRNKERKAAYRQMLKTYEKKAVVLKNQRELDDFMRRNARHDTAKTI